MSQGEWILTGGLDYQCSNCGMVPIFRPYNFCPNCGADMREEAKTEIADMRSITVKFTKIKELIDNWAVDDDEHVLLERIANIVDEEAEDENRKS